MKKNLTLVTIITLVFALLATPLNVEAASASSKGKGNGKKNTSTSETAPALYGRFSIESVNIDVALYCSSSQAVCDAEDSACYYNHDGMVIADHASQSFKPLTQVQVGDIATITRVDGTIATLQCVEVYDGHNTGTGLTDWDYNSVLGQHDYLTYTCITGATNIRICQWDTISDTLENTITTPAKKDGKANGKSKKNK